MPEPATTPVPDTAPRPPDGECVWPRDLNEPVEPDPDEQESRDE